MSEIIIRDVVAADNQQLIELVQTTLAEFGAKKGDGFAMDDEELLNMYESYQLLGKHYYVIEKEGKILGGAGVAPLEDDNNPNMCELRKMYFSPSLRGQGMGKIMIDQCILKAKEMGYVGMYLETINDMKIAQKLYLSRGFKYLDQRMGNTGHHACPVFMLKKL
jgi:putative acetyltransferase